MIDLLKVTVMTINTGTDNGVYCVLGTTLIILLLLVYLIFITIIGTIIIIIPIL